MVCVDISGPRNMECFDLFKSDPAYIHIHVYLDLLLLLLGIATLIFVRTCTYTCMVLGSEARSGFVGANRYHTVVENTLSIYLSLPLAAVGVHVYLVCTAYRAH